MIAAPASIPVWPFPPIAWPKRFIPLQPKGANGCQFAGFTKKAPTPITNRTAASLMPTIVALKLALS